MGRLGRTRATFEGTDDPLEMEALFRAFKKIGFGEGLLPGAITPGLGRIIGEGALLIWNSLSGAVQQEWP